MTATISELNLANALDGTEEYEVVQDGVSKRATAGQIRTLISAIINEGNVTSIQAGLAADRPDAGTQNRYYISTDAKKIERDTGAAWEVLAQAPSTIGAGDLGFDPATQAELNAHTGNTSNPHGVTKGQVDLGSVLNKAQLAKDGSETATGNLPMGGFKITGLADPTAAGDAVTQRILGSSSAGEGAALLAYENGLTAQQAFPAIPLDNVKALVDADYLQIDGLQAQLRAFYSDTDTGGGHVYWDADRAKSDANGGTIIDPDNVGTLSDTDLGTFLSQQGTGSGAGCWVRQHALMWVYDFGAKLGDLSFDSHPSIQKAISVGTSYLGDGAHFLSAEIELDNHTELYGMSATTSTLVFAGNGITNNTGGRLDNVKLSRIKIRSQSLSGTTGLSLNDVHNYVFSDITINSFGVGKDLESCWTGTFSDVRSTDNDIGMIDRGGNNNVEFRNPSISYNNSINLQFIDGGGKNEVFRNLFIEGPNSTTGITGNPKGSVFYDTYTEKTDTVIDLDGAKDFVFYNTTATDPAPTIKLRNCNNGLISRIGNNNVERYMAVDADGSNTDMEINGIKCLDQPTAFLSESIIRENVRPNTQGRESLVDYREAVMISGIDLSMSGDGWWTVDNTGSLSVTNESGIFFNQLSFSLGQFDQIRYALPGGGLADGDYSLIILYRYDASSETRIEAYTFGGSGLQAILHSDNVRSSLQSDITGRYAITTIPFSVPNEGEPVTGIALQHRQSSLTSVGTIESMVIVKGTPETCNVWPYDFGPINQESAITPVSPDANGEGTISHALGAVPFVQASIRGDNDINVDVVSADASEITIRIWDSSGDITSGTFDIDWLALR